MSGSDVGLIRDAYAALARGDFAALLDALDPCIEWPDGGCQSLEGCRGHEEVLAAILERIGGDARECRVEPQEFLLAGTDVVVLGHQHCRSRTSGRVFAIPFAHVWTIRDGLAVRFRSYADRPQLRAALAAGVADAR
jgi:uncharacterized protein